MGQKGLVRMNANTLADATGVVKMANVEIESRIASINKTINEMSGNDQIMNGGKISDDLNQGLVTLKETLKKLGPVITQVSKFLDNLTSNVDNVQRTSNVGVQARDSAEDSKRRLHSARN